MNLRLLQITDSALPIGGYTHSWGLEAAISRGLVHDPETLEQWTSRWLRTALGPLEGVLVAASCRATHAGSVDDLHAQNHLAEVSIVPPSTRRASREMGDQLVSLGSTWAWCARACRSSSRRPMAGAKDGTTASRSVFWARWPAALPRTC